MVTLEWTDEALVWLEEIHAYISSKNSEIASRVVREIYQKAQILSSFPRIGYMYPNDDGLEIQRHL